LTALPYTTQSSYRSTLLYLYIQNKHYQKKQETIKQNGKYICKMLLVSRRKLQLCHVMTRLPHV